LSSLARITDTPITSLEQLLPWNWQPRKPCKIRLPNLQLEASVTKGDPFSPLLYKSYCSVIIAGLTVGSPCKSFARGEGASLSFTSAPVRSSDGSGVVAKAFLVPTILTRLNAEGGGLIFPQITHVLGEPCVRCLQV